MRFTALSSGALLLAGAQHAASRFVMYADEWHPTRPTNAADRGAIDHVVLAFAMANNTAGFQPKVTMSTWRSEFPNAKIMIAVGGWGDMIGFSQAAKSDARIATFAQDVKTMLTNTGADGVDIDWEYPGGNGANYKETPNSDKAYEIEAYPKLLAAIRKAIGKEKLLSIAVPGKKIDMIAYTKKTGPLIWPSVDYINLMAYDLMNRRDTNTTHHTSVAGALEVVQNYLSIGAPPSKLNLGFAFYAKYFQTTSRTCTSPVGCPIALAEDPTTGKDTLTSGAWTFEPAHMDPVDLTSLAVSTDGTCGPGKGKCASGCCSQYGNCGTSPEHCSGACQHAFGTGCTDADIAGSWQLAASGGLADEALGGEYFFDAGNGLFWTWDTPEFIAQKFERVVWRYGLGGVMAWSLGEDSKAWEHIKKISEELEKGDAPTTEYPTSGYPTDGYPTSEYPAATKPKTTLTTSAKPPAETGTDTGYDVVNVDGGEKSEYDTGSDEDSEYEWVYYYTDDEDASDDEGHTVDRTTHKGGECGSAGHQMRK